MKASLPTNRVLGFVAALFFTGAAAAQDLHPERVVQGTTLTSARDPALSIQLPAGATHVGAERWILYDVADCELHVFVEADAQKNLKRVYWVQFEAVVPAKPESKYSYTGATTNLGGIDFFTRARFGPTNDTGRPGSDAEHMQRMLTEHGYKIPAEFINVRFTYLPDEQKRKELMIIYAEDLTSTGHTSAQLMQDNKPSELWAPLEKDLIERAQKNITIRKIGQ